MERGRLRVHHYLLLIALEAIWARFAIMLRAWLRHGIILRNW
jgi:hypothetical protein